MAKRHASLIFLSHQHLAGLVIGQRIKKLWPKHAENWTKINDLIRDVTALFDGELSAHFTTEDEVLFPAMQQALGSLPLITELRAEHRSLRALVVELQRSESMAQATMLAEFGERLKEHIRKEEEDLFVLFDTKMPAELAAALAEPIKQGLKGG